MPAVLNSPALIPILIEYQKQNYILVVIYDYALNLSQEVLLIWQYGISPLTYCYAFLLFFMVALTLPVTNLPVILSDRACLFCLADRRKNISHRYQEGVLLGIRECLYSNSNNQVLWIFDVVGNGGTCAYEFLLVAMLVYRSVIHQWDNQVTAGARFAIFFMGARKLHPGHILKPPIKFQLRSSMNTGTISSIGFGRHPPALDDRNQ
ncbi:hypothetical protein CONPUDRAFT_75536 [Coniophora puteana RWD-64-598 SS2]|uniref:DUF6533 domain-containing protein n=1 Tax=Coniophora puteana (strain RWD-64-598) TaxID=741705 RepID=A0A5M3MFN7_CONPW|nr:uncharacterized protein CONPUDRAFT_75536 [Coniophora puteana RWD-64-598 SS2]EIW77730.1 hypothetical protein CONPUDRAFT_75536 [Coniophora puteana RWD-64-598 SS2]